MCVCVWGGGGWIMFKALAAGTGEQSIKWCATLHIGVFFFVFFFNSFRTATRFFWLCRASLQDQYPNCVFRLIPSKYPFQSWWLACFHSNTVFLKTDNRLLYNLRTHKIWQRSVEKYKRHGTLSTTTHVLHMFCEKGVAQQCTEAQVGVVQDGLRQKMSHTNWDAAERKVSAASHPPCSHHWGLALSTTWW